jgi:hypothetical protein
MAAASGWPSWFVLEKPSLADPLGGPMTTGCAGRQVPARGEEEVLPGDLAAGDVIMRRFSGRPEVATFCRRPGSERKVRRRNFN